MKRIKSVLASGLVAVAALATLGLGAMGLTYGPCGTILAEMFPTAVRYTGSTPRHHFAASRRTSAVRRNQQHFPMSPLEKTCELAHNSASFAA